MTTAAKKKPAVRKKAAPKKAVAKRRGRAPTPVIKAPPAVKRKAKALAKRNGRPPIVETPEEMLLLAEAYFDDCDNKERPYTTPGLCYWMGFSNRFMLYQYRDRDPAFAAVVNRLRLRIEDQRVGNLVSGKGSVPGAIFDLKNNHEYSDKVENVNTHQGPNGEPIRHEWKITVVRPDD